MNLATKSQEIYGSLLVGAYSDEYVESQFVSDPDFQSCLAILMMTEGKSQRIFTGSPFLRASMFAPGVGDVILKDPFLASVYFSKYFSSDLVSPERAHYFSWALGSSSESRKTMDVVFDNQDVLSALLGISSFVSANIDNTYFLGRIFNSNDCARTAFESELFVDAMFDSVIAKRVLFDSRIGEVEFRKSNLAVTKAVNLAVPASASIQHNVWSAPEPLSTDGKWLIVACTDIYMSGTYTRGIRHYKNSPTSRSGDWITYSSISAGIDTDEYPEPKADNYTFVGNYGAFSCRFFTRLEVLARSGSTSSSNMGFLYIDMDN